MEDQPTPEEIHEALAHLAVYSSSRQSPCQASQRCSNAQGPSYTRSTMSSKPWLSLVEQVEPLQQGGLIIDEHLDLLLDTQCAA